MNGQVVTLFRKNLKKLMRKRGLTQQALSLGLGMNFLTVSQWFYKDVHMPKWKNYEKLCDYLDVGYWELLCEDYEEE